MRRLTPLILLTAAALVGCESQITGNEGNFQFSYPSDDRVFDFNKPVAVGAFLDLEVQDVGAQMPVTLSAASFDEADILMVSDFEGNGVTIMGMGDGGALLSVEGTTSTGELLTDSVNMLSRVPEVLLLNHTCDAGSTAAYLADQRVWVSFEMEMSNGQPVIGYGYYPVELSEGAPLTLVGAESGQQFMAFDTAATPGDATLSSQIDDTTLDISVVEPAAIDGVAEPVAFVLEDIDVGDINAFYVLPKAGELTICQADTDFEVASLSPEICEVTKSDPADANSYEYGWFEVKGVAEGTCSYTVTYPGGNAGVGASETFEFPIEP